MGRSGVPFLLGLCLMIGSATTDIRKAVAYLVLDNVDAFVAAGKVVIAIAAL